MRLTRTVLFASAVVLANCGDDTGGGPTPCTPSASQVCLTASTFNPTNLTVTAGATITWRDGSGITHTVTNDPGSAETFNMSVAASDTVMRQFNTAGTFNYHCTIHGTAGTGMHGTITVNN